jgi:cytochrome c oxidase subunit II
VGPDLGKLAKAEATAKFIEASIVDPNAEITKGYQPDIMPDNFGDQLSKEELDALVKYLLESQE